MVVFVASFTGPASAAEVDDQPQGRLGYTWVPDPPKRPFTPSDELGVEIVKYGGGGLIGLWLLRRMFSKE